MRNFSASHFSFNVDGGRCNRCKGEGHSLIVVDHNVQLMKAADYIIDLGPGAADDGGRVVARGTPEELVRKAEGPTAEVLARVIKRDSSPQQA